MALILHVTAGPLMGKPVAIRAGKTLRVGRHPKADHAFPDDKLMSSLHFAIECGEKGCRLLDLQSSNGTFLNGARVTEALLANGDEIRAGKTVFVIRMLPDEALPAALSNQNPAPHPNQNKSLLPPPPLLACTAACLHFLPLLLQFLFPPRRSNQLPSSQLPLRVNLVCRICSLRISSRSTSCSMPPANRASSKSSSNPKRNINLSTKERRALNWRTSRLISCAFRKNLLFSIRSFTKHGPKAGVSSSLPTRPSKISARTSGISSPSNFLTANKSTSAITIPASCASFSPLASRKKPINSSGQ